MSQDRPATASQATLAGLDPCHCCTGLSIATPAEVFNRPGLRAIQYRAGTHPLFVSSMFARLSGSAYPALQALRTRARDDFSIALLDAWGTALDILTFYQERIANESYLRTATERRSLLEQARLIGYEPRPGVAANAYVAFTVDDPAPPPSPGAPFSATPNAPSQVVIGRGTKVQSIPGPGEQAQLFETMEEIVAHYEWNALRPRVVQSHPIRTDLVSVKISGQTTFIKPGDTILIVGEEGADSKPVPKRVVRVSAHPETQSTELTLSEGHRLVPLPPPRFVMAPFIPSFLQLNTTFIREELVTDVSWKQRRLLSIARQHRWSPVAMQAAINQQRTQKTRPRIVPAEKEEPQVGPTPPSVSEYPSGIFGFHERASLYGHNAPKYLSLPEEQRGEGKAYPVNWDNGTLGHEQEVEPKPNAGSFHVFLDRTYPPIVKDSFVVIESAHAREVHLVKEAIEVSRADYAVSGKVTRLTLDQLNEPDKFPLRGTTVYAVSERLDLAPVSLMSVIEGNRVILDGAYLSLQVGQYVAVTGERDDLAGVMVSEVLRLSDVTLEAGFTVLTCEKGLTYRYVPSTVTINANVVAATHGETKVEVLGSGDASLAFQRFALRQPPLTYVGAATPSGGESTLEVWVNEQLWEEVQSLHGRKPADHVYVSWTDDDGHTIIQFGDGKTGARLPTGQNNVQARYRQGIGTKGLVKARQLSLLMTRPLGVREVTNPLDADGAADPESLDDIRRNSPLTLRTLDRIVSLQDYEDFAQAFSGIAKAKASEVSSGRTAGVRIIVAGTGGMEVRETSRLYDNLLRAIRNAGDPQVALEVSSYVPVFFALAAKVKVAEPYRSENVLRAVRDRLQSEFSFERRQFGQSLALGEVMAVMQQVQGVEAVYATQFYRTDAAPPVVILASELPAEHPAELLMLDPGSLSEIGAMT